MSAKKIERNRLHKIYGSLFNRHYFESMPGSLGCFYCGDFANTIDHCPPLHWVESRRMADWKKDGIKFLLIPCCTNCNKILSDRALFTTLSRTQYVKEKLEIMYEKAVALWSEDEILEMSPTFQKVIKAKAAKLKILHERALGAQWRENRELNET